MFRLQLVINHVRVRNSSVMVRRKYTHPHTLTDKCYVYPWGPLSFTSSETWSPHLPRDPTFTFLSTPSTPIPLSRNVSLSHTHTQQKDKKNDWSSYLTVKSQSQGAMQTFWSGFAQGHWGLHHADWSPWQQLTLYTQSSARKCESWWVSKNWWTSSTFAKRLKPGDIMLCSC